MQNCSHLNSQMITSIANEYVAHSAVFRVVSGEQGQPIGDGKIKRIFNPRSLRSQVVVCTLFLLRDIGTLAALCDVWRVPRASLSA